MSFSTERLVFPARTTADRRGNQRLLGLIAAHALLCQRQRQRDRQGRIVAAVEDYRVVHELLQPVLAAEVAGLSPRAGRAYAALVESAGAGLTRRDLSSAMGWSYNTSRRALDELLEQEVAVMPDRGPPARYRVLAAGLNGGAELLDPAALEAAPVARRVARSRPRRPR